MVSAPFFDDSFLAELEGLAAAPGAATPLAALEDDLHARLQLLLRDGADTLDEEAFATLSKEAMLDRTDALLETCRLSHKRGALEAVENFVVFFQALLPTLHGEASREIQRVFFRLLPVLLHIAWHDFAGREAEREEGRKALKGLESILLEIAGVRLQPSESDLVLRSIDQVAGFLAAGEYTMAEELVTARLLTIIRKNKVARALYRIMEVEVGMQVYLKEKLGYTTPQIRIPEDIGPLSDYGPLRVFQEDTDEGPKPYLQLQIPDLPRLRDVVVTLIRDDGAIGYEQRLDSLGSAALRPSSGTWRIGLTYEPEE
ncbi:MAG TPA: hypothetical protein VI589_04305 [Vicinamibacteria bacterium]